MASAMEVEASVPQESLVCGAHPAAPVHRDEVVALMREDSDEASELPTAHRAPPPRATVIGALIGLIAVSAVAATLFMESRPRPLNRLRAAGGAPQEAVQEVPAKEPGRTRGRSSMSLAQVAAVAAAEARHCHVARRGEVCYTKVLWAAQVGIREHPDRYPGLTVRSSLRDIQAALHAAGSAGCEEPCPGPALRAEQVADGGGPLRPDREQPPAPPTQLEPVGAASAGIFPSASRCNPTQCPGGLTCRNSAGGREERCCQPDDWECCGSGEEKFTSRLYCPSEGVYTVMCANGFCMGREDDCEGRGGVWHGARQCGSMPYAGCSPEEPGDAVQQARPPTCSSMEECQCDAAYPMVAYKRAAATGGSAGQVTWSCLPTPPTLLNSSGCGAIGGWHAGSAPGSIGVYVNPNFRGAAPLPVSNGQFATGQHVEAKYMDGNWYGATVSEARADGSFEVAWDDGDLRDRSKDAEALRASPSADQEFAAGEYVQARFAEDGGWYGATVVQANPGGTYEIRWDDGGTKDVTKRLSELRGSRGAPPDGQFAVGQHVEAIFSDGEWFPAMVTKANPNGTFKITWDDGTGDSDGRQPGELRPWQRGAPRLEPQEFTVGEYVQAKYDDGKWYGATVIEANRDGTFEIRWNDGEGEATKRPDDLRGSRDGASSGQYVVDQHVEAKFSDGDWYGAMVTQVNPNGTYEISWDDGGVEGAKGEEELRPGPWDRQELTAGEYVQARFAEDGNWYGATVVKANPDGSFKIRWDDGGTKDDTKRPEDLRGSRSAAASLADGEYVVGQHVEGKFPDGEWYPAMVTKASADGTFAITWDDGTGDDDGRLPESLRPWQTGAIPLAPQELTAGEYVQARFEDGKWYAATVLQANPDGTVDVSWDDGRGDATKRPEDLRGSRGGSSNGEYMVGQHVEGRFSDGEWYGAMVTQVNPDGTFGLGWDDGGDAAGVPHDELRPGPWGAQAGCHTAVPGEPCHELILWAIEAGLPGHPQWDGGALAPNATAEEIQASFARNGNSGCPPPCPREAMADE